MSCPPWPARPTGASLDAALNAAARRFINTPANTFFRDGTLHVSRLFDWYGDDFGGRQGVWAFIRRHAGPELAGQMDAAKERTLAYLPYDWSLNGR